VFDGFSMFWDLGVLTIRSHLTAYGYHKECDSLKPKGVLFD